MAIVGSNGLLTEGHFWVKFVSKIEVTANVRDWAVLVNATTDLVMDRQAFTADLNHFGVNYTDENGNVWTGTALWRWVSWSNYNGGVSNASLSAGYSVKIISGDGYSATIEDSRIEMNDNIIVAAKLNDDLLPDPYWPLTLIGSDISKSESIKNIVQMDILLNEESTTPVAEGWSIIVNGATSANMTQSAFEAQVSQVSASWTDSDNAEWTGTPLCRVVDWAKTNGIVGSDSLTAGFVIKVMAGEFSGDCRSLSYPL